MNDALTKARLAHVRVKAVAEQQLPKAGSSWELTIAGLG